ncbi:unnamed protein product, partial [Amoebophrya sp. A120]
ATTSTTSKINETGDAVEKEKKEQEQATVLDEPRAEDALEKLVDNALEPPSAAFLPGVNRDEEKLLETECYVRTWNEAVDYVYNVREEVGMADELHTLNNCMKTWGLKPQVSTHEHEQALRHFLPGVAEDTRQLRILLHLEDIVEDASGTSPWCVAKKMRDDIARRMKGGSASSNMGEQQETA